MSAENELALLRENVEAVTARLAEMEGEAHARGIADPEKQDMYYLGVSDGYGQAVFMIRKALLVGPPDLSVVPPNLRGVDQGETDIDS